MKKCRVLSDLVMLGGWCQVSGARDWIEDILVIEISMIHLFDFYMYYSTAVNTRREGKRQKATSKS